MGLIREPLDVHFVVDPRPLTESEKRAISEFIREDKAKRALSEKQVAKPRASGRSKATV